MSTSRTAFSIPLITVALASLMVVGCSEQAPIPEASVEPTPSVESSPITEAELDVVQGGEVAEKSYPEQWAEKAMEAKAGRGGVDVLGQAKQGDAKPIKVIRVGTLESWANELSIDEFATRAARYMRAMSTATESSYCGHICSAPGSKQGGPWSVDILTQNSADHCPVVPVCSVPNGSGLKHYGEQTQTVLYINSRVPGMGEEASNFLPGSTPNGHTFDFTTTEGKSVKINLNSEELGYYFMTDMYNLGFGVRQKPIRYVYDFQKNEPLSK